VGQCGPEGIWTEASSFDASYGINFASILKSKNIFNQKICPTADSQAGAERSSAAQGQDRNQASRSILRTDELLM
jgi:hypothetical protein